MYEIDDLVYPISRFCPGKCLNCNIYKEDPRIKDETSLAIFENIIKSKVLDKTFYYSLTGGESQLSPKFIPIIDLIGKYKPNAFVHSNTSGWHMKQTLAIAHRGIELFEKNKFRIDISIDGVREDYEKVRFTKNGWDKAMLTIKELLLLGLKPTLVMIVFKENYHSIEPFVEMCNNMGVNWFIGFAVESENFNNVGKLQYYTSSELDMIERSLDKVGFLKTKHYSNWMWAKSIYTNSVPEFKCFMGVKSIMIDAFGNVYPCGGAQEQKLNKLLSMGNVKDYNGNLDELLYDKKALKVLSSIEKKSCQPCKLLCAHKIEFPWGKHTGMRG